jgi:hypothetical protein
MTLTVTPRADLRAACSVQIHGAWSAPWNNGQTPNASLIEAIIGLGVGLVRDSLWCHNTAQQRWHKALADAGIGLWLNVVADRAQYAAADIAYLAGLPYADAVKALGGLNEPNAYPNDTWPAHTVAVQMELQKAADLFLPDALVVGPALKHEHVDYDADLKALAVAGIAEWCDTLDHHFYPSAEGPAANARERARAEAGYGAPVGTQSETGQTDTQCKDAGLKARWSVETYLRNYLDGVRLTSLYSLVDDSTGLFGLVGKPAETAVRELLATPDGGEDFPGWLAQHPEPSDARYVCTSEGGGKWTVYLLRGNDPTATLVLPGRGYKVDVGTETVGPRGNERELELLDSLTVVHVSTD